MLHVEGIFAASGKDGTTHTKASPLPKGVLRNTRDILEAIDDLFNYTNTSNRDKLQLTIPQPLNF